MGLKLSTHFLWIGPFVHVVLCDMNRLLENLGPPQILCVNNLRFVCKYFATALIFPGACLCHVKKRSLPRRHDGQQDQIPGWSWNGLVQSSKDSVGFG